MFDHNISRRTWSRWTSARRWCANHPGVWEKAAGTEAPHAKDHGYKTIGDIMKSVKPESRASSPRGAPGQPLHARDVLPDGRAARASLHALSGGVERWATVQLFTPTTHPADALRRVRQARGPDARRPVRLLLPGPAGYEEVGKRRILLGCWGVVPDRVLQLHYKDMTQWGREDVRHPGRGGGPSSSPPTWSRSTSASASCSGHSTTRTGPARRCSSPRTRWGTSVDARHPWNQHTIPMPQSGLRRQLHLGDVAALVRRKGPSGRSTPAAPAGALVAHGPGGPGGHRVREVDRAAA